MPDLHHKPTSEELEEGIRKSQEELDKLDGDSQEESTETTETTESEQTTEENQSQEESREEEVTQPEGEKESIEPDYKEKFTHSMREAQILAARNKKFNEAVDAADGLNDIADEELKLAASSQGFDIEDMTVVEKSLFKTNILNQRKLDKISEVAKEGRNIEEWNTKVDTYIDDPKTLVANTDLEGKTEEFKIFATKPTRRGVDFDTLVSSFLWETEQAKVKHKGNMFERGSGGANEKPKPHSDRLSVMEGAKLQQTNYKKWKEYLIAGKIASE